MNHICTKRDDWLNEQDRTLWICKLSNGETVFQDDNRPGVEPASAWERLGFYVKENGLAIVSMRLEFRSHTEWVGKQAFDGYFFVKSALGGFGLGKTIHSYVAGVLSDGLVRTKKWRVPELVPEESDERDPASAGPCLIRNYDANNQNRWVCSRY